LLQTALFLREGRRLRLTAAGVSLRRAASSSLSELAACVAGFAIAEAAAKPRSLTISIPPALGASWLTTAITDVADATGLTSFRVLSALRMTDVDWRETDIAIVYGNPPWHGFSWQPLASVTTQPACSPQLLNGPTALRQPNDVLSHRLLHYDDGFEWQRWLSAAKVPVAPVRNAYFGTLVHALAAVLDGRGVALVSDYVARGYLATGRLVRPFDLKMSASGGYFVVVSEQKAHDPLLVGFVNRLVGAGVDQYMSLPVRETHLRYRRRRSRQD
jgi:LysR family glycine cleavage system transcriptional activator